MKGVRRSLSSTSAVQFSFQQPLQAHPGDIDTARQEHLFHFGTQIKIDVVPNLRV